MREQTLDELLKRRISAIIRTADRQLAAEAMSAAIAGGFRVVEFTLTTPGALDLIADFSQRDPPVVVGAGTVMSPADARRAVQAGARFLVSPVCDPEVICCARQLGAVSIPGTFTPTEMNTAHRCGADLVKLFPAPADVPSYVAAVLGPMPYLKIFPTAGVDLENMLDVLAAGAAGIGFVRSLFRPEELAAGDFTAIERRALQITRRLASAVEG